MRRLIIVAVACLMTAPLSAQAGPELDAVLDAFFAKDLKSLSQHLPPELAETIKNLTPEAREEVPAHYLLAEQQLREGAKITRPGNGIVLVIERPARGEESPAESAEIYLEKRLSDSNETMLRFRPKYPEGGPSWRDDARLTVWVRFVEDEWRVYEIDISCREIRLDDPGYLQYLKRPRPSPNEASAIGSMRTINTAAVVYSSTYPDIGFPQSLADLGGVTERNDGEQDGTDQQSSESHAGLVDEMLSSPPFEKSGYRFIYNRRSPTEYVVVARPLQYGTAGLKSFYTDESGVIRCTSEDREATVEDDPLQ